MVNIRNSAALLGLWFLCSAAEAGQVTVHVSDKNGGSLENVVIYAESGVPESKVKASKPVEISQQGRQFVPLVTVVQTGTEISFPNYDSVKHNVYSFSPAKPLDLPLYSGKPAVPQLFDKPGTVVLGCNIHDRMIAYVEVVNTPYFGKSDAAGVVRLEGLPAGAYQLKAWYYGLPTNQQTLTQTINVTNEETSAVFKINSTKPQANSAGAH